MAQRGAVKCRAFLKHKPRREISKNRNKYIKIMEEFMLKEKITEMGEDFKSQNKR